jgi:PAS domain S-box-containing protein
MNESMAAVHIPQPTTAPPEESALRPRVLIVDDEASFRSTFADILATRGYECKTAASVSEAIANIERESADIYLIDLKLPDGTGLDILTKVREVHPSAETIILTGFSSLSTAVQSLNLGAFGYLEKPYNIDRLFITLERALDRQRLVRRLHHSEAAYSGLFQASGVAIFSLELPTFKVISANPAFRRLLGYSPEEIPNLDGFDLLPESMHARLRKLADGPARAAACGSALASPATDTIEAPLLHRDGTPRWFSISFTRLDQTRSAAPSSGADVRGTQLLLVCNDITSARRELTELEEHRDFLEAILSTVPSGIAIVDSDYRISYANPAYCRFVELDCGEVTGRRCYEAFNRYQSPCSMFGELCPITSARTTGAIGRVYREHQSRDGNRRQIEYTANPFRDASGNVTSFVIAVNDVADLRAAEERVAESNERLGLLNTELSLRQQELEQHALRLKQANVELLRLSNAKGEFVATVSHELRTPLTAITEGINLCADGSLGAINPEQETFLKLAYRNSRRLADLINDLLDLSKIEAGKFDLVPRVLEPARVVNDVVSFCQNLAKEKGLKLEAELAPDVPPVIADEQALQRILTNLIGNALKFTPSGGSVTIRCRTQEPGTKNQEPGTKNQEPVAAVVAFSVEDTGIGIPKDEQHRIFGKFEQVANTDGMRPQGTGLGLALTRQLVEMNQGRIWFESEEGKGTRFFFTLPGYEEFCYLALSLKHFADQHPFEGNRNPAAYLFELARPTELHAAREVLAQIEEIARTRSPQADIIAPVLSRRSVFIFSPTSMTPERYQASLDSLQGTSFFSGHKEVEVALRVGMLEFGPAADGPANFAALAGIVANPDPRREYEQLRELFVPGLKEVR